MGDFYAEDFLPHRGRMKLIDKIIHISSDKAVTESMVTDQWPLFQDCHVSPIVLIELVAQTAGIYIAWNKEREIQRTGTERGWVVGINAASFYTDQIQLKTIISTHTSSKLSVDNYMKINGKAYIRENLVGEIGLQLFWVESGEA